MNSFGNYETISEKHSLEAAVTGFMTKVYGWMCCALFITAITAWYVSGSEQILSFIFNNSAALWILLIAEFGLVVAISAAINKISAQTAILLFVLYSLLTGATLSIIFLVYTAESIATTFGLTGITFGIMSIYGLVTKKDLSSWGNILFMALIGLILATVVNIFWASSTLYWITTYAGIIIFVGLTAYDTQKLRKLSLQINPEESETYTKTAILGALTLYLDFINMFLYLLRLFGKRK